MSASSYDDRLLDLLLSWEQLRAQGRELSVQELCANAPDLNDVLAERIRQLQALEAPLRIDGELTARSDRGTSQARANDKPAALAVASASRYHRLRLHARGGLGEVFVARDEELDRDVALKQIREQLARDPKSRSRFLLEAQITASLEHPGVVPIHGLGNDPDGRLFYAMRLIQGESLKEAIAKFHAMPGDGSAPGERARALQSLLRRFLDVCNTMAYAHSRAVLHRDLKPSNIMLGQYGETLVVDWGLAKVFGAGEKDSGTAAPRLRRSDDTNVTHDGTIIGTPAFMSPEQAKGEVDRLGPASDIYSLGATLYCVLSGQPPRRLADPNLDQKDGEIWPIHSICQDVPRT